MRKMREETAGIAERAIFGSLLVLLVLAPLPFGADRPWSWTFLAGAIGVLLAAWGLLAAVGHSFQPAGLRPLAPAVGLFLLVVVWAALQSVQLVPEAWRHPLWAGAAAALSTRTAGTVSVDVFETRTALMRLLSYGGVFLLTFQLCTDARRSERLIRVVMAAALVYACYGLAMEFAGVNKVLWYDNKDSAAGQLSSTFLYRNAFATYAGLGLMCAMALLFRPAMRRGDLDVGWRFATRALADYMFARTWFLMAVACVLFSAILMTHSRAGLAVTILGISVFLALMAWTRRRRIYVAVASALVLVCAAAILVAGGASTMARMGTVSAAFAERTTVYERTVQAVADAPLLGTGYGTYARAFARHRGEEIKSPFERAHNSYLENALELGIPATAALVLAMGWVVLVCVAAVLRHKRRAFLPGLGIAAAALAGSHAVVDYSIQIPAVAMTFAAIMGAACAQSLRLGRPEKIAYDRRRG